ncbi:MAG: hypothetical protein ACKVVT_04790 [Dehalococcoidia bacterium]
MAGPRVFVHRRPQGRATRGKTAPNRLRRVDSFVLRYDRQLIARDDGALRGAIAVDLGYGADPSTTLELAARFRRHNPGLQVAGVEIDRARVEAALPFADERTHFRLGGFNVPLSTDSEGRRERARFIRAFNVLRQYDEADVAGAWELMGGALAEGGLLIEGTSDPLGRRWVANVLRRRGAGLVLEAMVFCQSFRVAVEFAALQAVLPKSAIHRVSPGEPIATFFEAWKAAAREAAPAKTWGERAWFVAAGEALARAGYAVDRRRAWLRDGYLIWRHPELPSPTGFKAP